MATIASLYVNLTASTASFSRQMGAAAKIVQSFGRGLLSITTQLAKYGAAAVAAAAGGLTALTVASANALDEVGKMSDRLGVATETLIGWMHGAGLAGVGAEEFGKAIETMSRRIGEAAFKGGATAQVLEALGFSAAELANMTTEEQFRAIADAIASIQNPAERALAAYTLFGRTGQQLINLLATGSAGLAAAVAEAERLGLTVSRLDAAKVEEMNDQISRVKSLLTGVGNQLAVQVAPILSAIAGKLLELATQGDGIRERVGGAFSFLAKSAAWVYEFGKAIGIVFHGLAGSIERVIGFVTSGVVQMLKGINLVTGGMDEAIANLERWRDARNQSAVDHWQQAMEMFSSPFAVDQVEDFLTEVNDLAEKAAQPVLELNEAFEDMGITFEELDAQAKVLEDLQREAERIFQETRTPLEKFEQQREKLDDLLRRELIDLETYERAMKMAREELDRFNQSAQAGSERTAEFQVVDRALFDFDRGPAQRMESLVPAVDRSNEILSRIEGHLRRQNEGGVA